jgi:hypothetical protein
MRFKAMARHYSPFPHTRSPIWNGLAMIVLSLLVVQTALFESGVCRAGNDLSPNTEKAAHCAIRRL